MCWDKVDGPMEGKRMKVGWALVECRTFFLSREAMVKVSSSSVIKSSRSSLFLHALVNLFFRVSIFFNTPKSFINAVEAFNSEECVQFSRNTLNRH